MMSRHRKSSLRNLGGTAALALLLAGGLGFSAATAAEDQDEKAEKVERKEERKEVRHVFIHRVGDEAEGKAHNKHFTRTAHCTSGKKAESEVSSGDGKEKFFTHIVVCGEDGEDDPALKRRLIEGLERARADMSSGDKLSEARRAEALAALQREIDRLKAEATTN